MTHHHLLPPHLIELQLGHLDLLSAMYPDELSIPAETTTLMDTLRNDPPTLPVPSAGSPVVAGVTLRVDVPNGDGDEGSSIENEAENKELELHLSVPFTYATPTEPSDPPRIRLRIAQPPWLSRAETTSLGSAIPELEDGADQDLLGDIDAVKEAASSLLAAQRTASASASGTGNGGASAGGASSYASEPLVRVWFYFPSISTRAKRDDFITWAPTYGLTGFLYAGKPGLLCVEGASRAVDEYMRFIKTESWGDIPAGHKKVSERLREEGEDVKRAFGGMEEITDSVGERRGVRQNRGDMRAVEEWLGERGLGERLGRVLM